MLVYTLLLAVSVAVIARVIASAIADPLEPIVAGAAPTWMVQVRTTGSRPGTALVYGRDVGVQFLQIPAGDGSTSEARVIPARLAKGELHLITLSWTSLHVFGTGPKGSALLSYGATSPIVTLFQTKESTGVRTGW